MGLNKIDQPKARTSSHQYTVDKVVFWAFQRKEQSIGVKIREDYLMLMVRRKVGFW